MRSLRWASIQSDWYPYKKRKFVHSHAQREDHVKRQGEDSHLPAKERSLQQTLPSQPWEGTKCAHTPILEFQPPELEDNTFLPFKPLSL